MQSRLGHNTDNLNYLDQLKKQSRLLYGDRLILQNFCNVTNGIFFVNGKTLPDFYKILSTTVTEYVRWTFAR